MLLSSISNSGDAFRVGVVGSIKLLRVALEKVNSKPLLTVLKLSCTTVSLADRLAVAT
jgi:hypothetical protein